jgi:hypothetical protein
MGDCGYVSSHSSSTWNNGSSRTDGGTEYVSITGDLQLCAGVFVMSKRKPVTSAKALLLVAEKTEKEAKRQKRSQKKKNKNKDPPPAVCSIADPQPVVTTDTETTDAHPANVAAIPKAAGVKSKKKKVLSATEKLVAVKKKLPPDLRSGAQLGDTLGTCLVEHLPVVGGASGVYIPLGVGPSSVPRRKTVDTETVVAIDSITDRLCQDMSGVQITHPKPIQVLLGSPKLKKTDFIHDLLLVLLATHVKGASETMPWKGLTGPRSLHVYVCVCECVLRET